ncbi:hypothetical protein [Streptomyces kronopolitis]
MSWTWPAALAVLPFQQMLALIRAPSTEAVASRHFHACVPLLLADAA